MLIVNPGATVMLKAFVAEIEPESVTRTVKLLVPETVAEPEITPVPAASVRPVGRTPEAIDHVYGGVPPAAVSVTLYEAFRPAPGNDSVVIPGAGRTFKLRACVAVEEKLSVTCTVKLLVPETVGVPEIMPVLGASANPLGSVPETIDQL